MILCNPNALFYHHLVNSPNAFWLNFFLKKGVNVMAWNYRGYGDTKGTPDPYNIKMDGESVVRFVAEDMGVTGRLGIYGRSLGGVVATHVAAQFPDKIALLIADRTFGSLKSVSTRKFVGLGTSALYDLVSFKWETDNDINFLNAKCFKILSCDPIDDVVDEYASLCARVGLQAYLKHLPPFMSKDEEARVCRLMRGLVETEQMLEDRVRKVYGEDEINKRRK